MNTETQEVQATEQEVQAVEQQPVEKTAQEKIDEIEALLKKRNAMLEFETDPAMINALKQSIAKAQNEIESIKKTVFRAGKLAEIQALVQEWQITLPEIKDFLSKGKKAGGKQKDADAPKKVMPVKYKNPKGDELWTGVGKYLPQWIKDALPKLEQELEALKDDKAKYKEHKTKALSKFLINK